MGLANVYVQVYGQLPEFFTKIREGQAPIQFTQQLLKDLGFASTNHRKLIPLLKALGFLSADGKPTSKYHDYRDYSRSKQVMGQAIKEAYSDIFLIKENPTKSDREAIQGKFKSYYNANERVAQLMTNTFFALLDLADLKASPQKSKPQGESAHVVETEQPVKEVVQKEQRTLKTPSLHYNIQIHLPATKDVEVYNAIFRSLKEHLFEI